MFFLSILQILFYENNLTFFFQFQDQDLSKEITHEASPVGSEASVSNSHEFDRALERVEILTSQLVLHLIEGLVDNSPNIVVNEAHKQVLETSLPTAPKISIINVNQVIYDCQAKLVMTLWQSIQPKLTQTPFNQLSLIEADVQKILSVMEEIKLVDSSCFEKHGSRILCMC